MWIAGDTVDMFLLDNLGQVAQERANVNTHSWSALLSAAAYLCSAVDDLRGAGYGAFAEEISHLIETLDAELLLSRDDR